MMTVVVGLSVALKIPIRSSVLGSNILNPKYGSLLLNDTCLQNLSISPSRTTVIVKRRYPVPLHKEENKPRLQRKTFHYIKEEDTEMQRDTEMDIVLTKYVSGVGNPGDIISMKKLKAYYHFLVPGLADYPTPENLKYSKSLQDDADLQRQQVPARVDICMKFLEKQTVLVFMNKETEWTIEPWHVRASFRTFGVDILSDSSIEMPKQPIRGPNLDLEGKTFSVVITVNKNHKVKSYCRIHHWSTDPMDRLPFPEEWWLKPKEFIFPEEEQPKDLES